MKTTALGLKLVYVGRMYDIPDVTAKDWWGVCWSKYRELLDYFDKKIVETLPR